jgi:hypothetical protein
MDLMTPLAGWALAVAYARSRQAEKAAEKAEWLKRAAPHCKGLAVPVSVESPI